MLSEMFVEVSHSYYMMIYFVYFPRRTKHLIVSKIESFGGNFCTIYIAYFSCFFCVFMEIVFAACSGLSEIAS
jgi:hypothetical protein